MNETNALTLVSVIEHDGTLRLSLDDVELRVPGPDEVVIEVRAAPVNPSDLRLLLGPVDASSLKASVMSSRPVIEGRIPDAAMGAVRGRLGKKMPVGNEGAGIVVGAGNNVSHLVGRTLAFFTGQGSYATHSVVDVRDCILIEKGVPAAAAAGAFINPLTTLCMIETLRRERHGALVHTAAASNVGQMLSRLCIAEGIPLVNIVRTKEQVALLQSQGAVHVVDSTSADFAAELAHAIQATGATLAFDAIGGGRMASKILAAMERVCKEKMATYSAYGSSTHKQVYNYGLLDPSSRIIDLDVGTAWGIGGWLMVWEFSQLDESRRDALKARVAKEMTTTFASHYKGAFTLSDLLSVTTLNDCMRRGTNQKYIVVPNGDSV